MTERKTRYKWLKLISSTGWLDTPLGCEAGSLRMDEWLDRRTDGGPQGQCPSCKPLDGLAEA